MTKEEYIEKMNALAVPFWQALKDNDLNAASCIKKEMRNLLTIASNELNLGDFLDVAAVGYYSNRQEI